ncbi:hypothetical protein 1 [Hubei tombus-like virus 19]|uniref:hypothetical protein 1 n=1 Tax=Hubei tombus-like virus 19 TaxID=1923265 RepID=UPI00090A2117|nr:hypothetical protein 1 [Hubei tombus-like virus 19]APG76544.1 hypothetical protein 1 [Hubei tombus-like virus 19]
MNSLKSWLLTVADYCDRDGKPFSPVLVKLWQIHYGKIEDPVSALYELTGVQRKDSDERVAGQIVRTIRNYQSQDLSYRRFVTRIQPFPTAAHFEYLAFGERVPPGSPWGQLSNRVKSEIIKEVAKLPDKPDYTAISESAGKFFFDRQFGEHVPGSSAKAFGTACHERGVNSRTKHNTARFVRWANSEFESPRFRRVWNSLSWRQQQRVCADKALTADLSVGVYLGPPN